jgi:hypothetical protein
MSIASTISLPNTGIQNNSIKAHAKTGLVKRVCEFVKKIFTSIANFFLFPTRYIGSKTWSIPGIVIRTPFILFKRIFGFTGGMSLSEEILGKGYQFNTKTLDKNGTKKMMRGATFSTAVHNFTPKWKDAMDSFNLSVVKPTDLVSDQNSKKLPKNIDVNEVRFFDKKSGLKMMVAANEDEVLVSFGALGAPRAEIETKKERDALENKIWIKIVCLGLSGIKPDIYEEANRLFTAIKGSSAFQGKTIKLVGHCMGGSLATYVGLKHKLEVQSFNTLAFGPGLQQQVGAKALSLADRYVTHLSIENDSFSDCKYLKGLDVVANLMGIKTAGNFGKHYRIPAAKDYAAAKKYSKRQDDIHNFFLGSMMEYIGESNRQLPQNLVNDENRAEYIS